MLKRRNLLNTVVAAVVLISSILILGTSELNSCSIDRVQHTWGLSLYHFV